MSIGTERTRLHLKMRRQLLPFTVRSFQTLTPAQDYQHNWHIEAIAWHLQQCATGAIKRLLITVPPRYLKSICASIAFPAWVLGRDPAKRIICVSYSEDLAIRFSRNCRAIMQCGWYRDVFPRTVISAEKNTQHDFATTRHGFRYATSVGGTLTGMGGSIIVIDDPLKPEDAMSQSKRSAVNDWFDSTLYSRLDNKREDVIILIMQRLHLDDLAGYVTRKEDWAHLNLPAKAPCRQLISIGPDPDDVYTREEGELLHESREGQSQLDALRAGLGTFNFSAQYQQCPIPEDGEIVKWEWFKFYDQPPPRVPGDRIIQSWDTASKPGELNDFSVCTTWLIQGNHYFLLDIFRDKPPFPDLKRKIVEKALTQCATAILIEDKGSGTALIQELQYSCDGTPPPIAIAPEGDKVMRMSAQSAKIEAGQVHLPREAPWLEDFRAEILQFPKGRHDDQVDSVSQFLNWIEARGTGFSVVPLSEVLYGPSSHPSAPPWWKG